MSTNSVVNYINLAFDYDTIYEKNGEPSISNDIVSSRGTSRIEFLDDVFFYRNGLCVSVIAGSRQDKESFIFRDGEFSVHKTNDLEKKFYKEFGAAKTPEECEMIWQGYNDALFDFAVQSLDKITHHRKKKGLAPIVYDYVHTPSTWLNIGAAKKLAQYLGIGLASTVHVKEREIQSLMGNQYPWADFIVKKGEEAERDADRVIAKNKSLCEEIREINPHCVYIANDLKFSQYNEKVLLRKDPHMVLYVGRISYAKGFDRFAEIIKQINKTPNRFVFTICGPLRDDGKLANHIAKLKTYKNVYFEGQVSRVAIEDVFLNAGTYILASRTEIYNQATMEALYFGCNVIATDVGETKEQVGDCRSGYILPNDDNFVDNALKLLYHMDYGYEKSLEAYRYANKKFNSNTCRQYKMDFLNKTFAK